VRLPPTPSYLSEEVAEAAHPGARGEGPAALAINSDTDPVDLGDIELSDPIDIINDEVVPDTAPGAGRRAVVRLLLLGTSIATLLALSVASGLTEQLTAESIRTTVAEAGAWGIALYMLIFIGGQMLHLPGLIFIGAGAVAFGAGPGALLALLGGTLATAVNFVFVRMVGGQPVHALKHPIARRGVALLDERPLRAILGLRLVFFTSPAITTVFALSNVRFRDHLLGSAIGMAPAIIGSAIAIALAV
jgi:uncharacterized membrane protein YdjX (TVP38/TMEM64 family)